MTLDKALPPELQIGLAAFQIFTGWLGGKKSANAAEQAAQERKEAAERQLKYDQEARGM